MELTRRIVDGVTIFTFGPQLTYANIGHIAAAVDAQIQLGAVELVFNLSQVELIDRGVLEYFAFTHGRLPTLRGELVLSAPSPYLEQVLDSAPDMRFTRCASDAGAVEYLRDPSRHRRT